MARRVKGPDGTLHDFPDDATDQEISLALETPPVTARGKPARSWADVAVDSLPMLGGALGGIVGGVGGTAFGMGVGGVPGAVGGATLGGGAGEAGKQLINRWRGVETPGTPLQAAEDIGTQGAVQGALEGTGQAVTAGLVKGGTAVYRGILKPSLSKVNVSKAADIVRTAIDEALPMTEAGASQAQQRIVELRQEVEGILTNTKGEVNLSDIAAKVRAFARRKYYLPGKPTADYEAAMKVADELDQHPSVQNPFAPQSPARTNLSGANKVKRGIDEAVGEANFGVDRGATKTTQKVARREVRRAIEAKAPSVGPLNARESKLIDVAKALERGVARDSNRSQIEGVRNLIATGVGTEEYARTKNPVGATATALAIRAGMSPAVASRVAILAVKLGEKVPGQVPAALARAAYRAISESQQQPEGVPGDTAQDRQ